MTKAIARRQRDQHRPMEECPPFETLERTREMGVQYIHGQVWKLTQLPELNEKGAKQLALYMGLLFETERLEIQRYLATRKTGGVTDPEPAKEESHGEEAKQG